MSNTIQPNCAKLPGNAPVSHSTSATVSSNNDTSVLSLSVAPEISLASESLPATTTAISYFSVERIISTSM